MHLTSSAADWYATRAAGVVAYLLLTSVVAIGVLLAGKKPLRTPRFAIEDVHRFLGLLAGVFLSLHIGTIAIDSFVRFSIPQLLVPFAASYRPIWTGIGIVSAELLVALAVTNLLRRRLPYRAWRRLHYLSFLVWVGATVHGVGGGTDRGSVWLLGLFAGSVALVVGGTAARIARTRDSPFSLGPAALIAGAGAFSVGALVLVSSLVTSPAAPQANGQPPSADQAVSIDEPVHGEIVVRNGPAYGLLSVVGEGSGASRVLLRIDLLARGDDIVGTSLQVELGDGQTCTGSVDQIDRSGFAGSCTLGGVQKQVQATWQVDSTTTTVEGNLEVV
jgi:methionine sulfoxide reductase heme-binding subunit